MSSWGKMMLNDFTGWLGCWIFSCLKRCFIRIFRFTYLCAQYSVKTTWGALYIKLEGSIPWNSGHSIHIFGAIAQDNFLKIEALGSAILWQRKHPLFTNGLCLLKESKITSLASVGVTGVSSISLTVPEMLQCNQLQLALRTLIRLLSTTLSENGTFLSKY